MKPVRRPQESGAVLIVGLLVLLVLTILGISAMNNAILEQKMTGNVEDANIAMQAAEAALREGETLLQMEGVLTFDGTNGLYPAPVSALAAPRWTTVDWQSDAAVRVYSGFADAPGNLSGTTARYFIEELAPVTQPGQSLGVDIPTDESGIYRVTARGSDPKGGTVVILQSTYAR